MGSLLKLTMTASAPTTTSNPTVSRFFHTAPAGGHTGALTYTLTADGTTDGWIDDNGAAVIATGITTIAANNGYYQLFINGALQEESVLTSVSDTSVVITFDANTTIEEGKIITLVVSNFAPTTTAPVITG